MTITKSERQYRKRVVKAGMWDDVVIEFVDGSRYVSKCEINVDGQLVATVGKQTRDEPIRLHLCDLADVVRVHR